MKTLPILPILAAVLLPLGAWCSTPPDANPAVSAPSTPADVPAKLSIPAREVVKMALSGVTDDVIKAYIANSSSTFNLNADAIISLHGVGVSTSVTAAMLSHDRLLVDNSQAFAAAAAQSAAVPAAQSATQAVAPYQDVSAPNVDYSNTYPYYNQLAPYGSWDYLPDYGWCWQPSDILGYPFFAGSGVLFGTGRWFHHPTRGLIWCPGDRFGGSRFIGGTFRSAQSVGGNFRGVGGVGSFHGFASTGVRPSTFRPPTVIHSTVGGGHAGSTFHGFNSGVSVTHIGGGRSSGGFGGHSGGSFGGHSGGFASSGHGHR